MAPELIILLVLSVSLNFICGTMVCYKFSLEQQAENNIPVAVIVNLPEDYQVPRARPLPSPTSSSASSLDSLTI